MNTPTANLFWACAAKLSSQLKVFVLSGTHTEVSTLIETQAKELVYLCDDSFIEGLKVRSDYRERARSKDLLVDPEGSTPTDEVTRLLKKNGIYLSLAARSDFPTLATTPIYGYSEGQLLSVSLEATGGDPLFYAYSLNVLEELPKVTIEVEVEVVSQATSESEDTKASEEEMNELRTTLKKEISQRKRARTELKKVKDQIKVLELQEVREVLKVLFHDFHLN